MHVIKQLEKLREKSPAWKPLIYAMANETDRKRIESLIEEGLIMHVIDDYEEQLRELFQINNPSLVYRPNFDEEFQRFVEDIKLAGMALHGNWVYFPWSCTLVHILDDA